jgi:CBS domain-containing protein
MSTQRTHIASIMRTAFERLQPATPIREAVARLARRSAAAAPVIDEDGRLVGILTQKDCFRPMLGASYYDQWEGTVETFMSRNVATLPETLDFVSAAEAFLARSHRVYPVMRDLEIVGLLHRSDLFAALVELSGSAQPRAPETSG